MHDTTSLSVSTDDKGKLHVTLVVPEYNQVVTVGWDHAEGCPSLITEPVTLNDGSTKGTPRWAKVIASSRIKQSSGPVKPPAREAVTSS